VPLGAMHLAMADLTERHQVGPLVGKAVVAGGEVRA